MNIVNPSNIINIYIAEYSEHTKGYFTSFYTLCIYCHKPLSYTVAEAKKFLSGDHARDRYQFYYLSGVFWLRIRLIGS